MGVELSIHRHWWSSVYFICIGTVFNCKTIATSIYLQRLTKFTAAGSKYLIQGSTATQKKSSGATAPECQAQNKGPSLHRRQASRRRRWGTSVQHKNGRRGGGVKFQEGGRRRPSSQSTSSRSSSEVERGGGGPPVGGVGRGCRGAGRVGKLRHNPRQVVGRHDQRRKATHRRR